jgi:uncharacterized membrane protein YgdD (TMEM256/DUF423 family)
MTKQQSTLLLVVSISGALAVALGAFGSHTLRDLVSENQIEIWKTASFYHFVHTLALVSLSFIPIRRKAKALVAVFFMIGILFFCGSLYLLATANLHSLPSSILGPVTPLGGLLFIAGWLTLGYQAFKAGRNTSQYD